MITLEFGKQHAKENGATHHRQGDIYKVNRVVKCWENGKWVNCNDHWDLESWMLELTPINWDECK